ncbi:MAG: hypothetical protein PHG69_04770 [Candidatus Omnitrophica bacterium]|nr:hypothetical protein [Candidatus Omnitrophota bacterium]
MNTMDKDKIKKILPHREPMLLIDAVLDIQVGKSVIAIRKTTKNDFFFEGHFPGKPIMPGTLIVEAMAQASLLL